MAYYTYKLSIHVTTQATNSNEALENINKHYVDRIRPIAEVGAVALEKVIFEHKEIIIGNLRYDEKLDMIQINSECYLRLYDIQSIEPNCNKTDMSRCDGNEEQQYAASIVTISGHIFFLDNIIKERCHYTNEFLALAKRNCEIYNNFLNNIKLLRQMHDDNK